MTKGYARIFLRFEFAAFWKLGGFGNAGNGLDERNGTEMGKMREDMGFGKRGKCCPADCLGCGNEGWD